MLEKDPTDKKKKKKNWRRLWDKREIKLPLSELTVMKRTLEIVKNRKLVVFSILELHALDINSNT